MQKFKDLPSSEKPREKMLQFGSEPLTDAELLAILLRTGSKNKTVLQLAQEIISNFGITGLSKMEVYDLKQIKGIGSAKASEIKAVFEIASRLHEKTVSKTKKFKEAITGPEDIAEIMIEKLQFTNQELFFTVLLTTKNTIISFEEISRGGLNIASIFPREVFNKAIRQSAAKMILVHNHPSGDPTPSSEDINLTNRLMEAGKLIGIRVLDHVIIGEGDYISLKEQGLICD